MVLPGIQLLAAFLLILPFSTGFKAAVGDHKAVYFVAFVTAVFASVLSLAPSSQHRIRWREGDKEALMRTANRLTISASLSLAVSMATSTFLVTQVLYAETWASVVAGVMGVAMVWWWFLQPMLRRARDGRERD